MFYGIFIRMVNGGKHKMNKQLHKLYKGDNILLKDIKNNFNIYIRFLALFLLGICLGVILLNKLNDNQLEHIYSFITESLKSIKNFSSNKILKKSLIKNTFISLIFWSIGLTIYGKYLIHFITISLGIMLGYTISAISLCFDFNMSLLLTLCIFLLPNIIFIPTLLLLSVQEIKCHRIFSNTHDVKRLFITITIINIISWFFLIISSFVEAYISSNIINSVINIL